MSKKYFVYIFYVLFIVLKWFCLVYVDTKYIFYLFIIFNMNFGDFELIHKNKFSWLHCALGHKVLTDTL